MKQEQVIGGKDLVQHKTFEFVTGQLSMHGIALGEYGRKLTQHIYTEPRPHVVHDDQAFVTAPLREISSKPIQVGVLKEVYTCGNQMGLSLCTPDEALEYRIAVLDLLPGTNVFVAMVPIVCGQRKYVFVIRCTPENKQRLDAVEVKTWYQFDDTEDSNGHVHSSDFARVLWEQEDVFLWKRD